MRVGNMVDPRCTLGASIGKASFRKPSRERTMNLGLKGLNAIVAGSSNGIGRSGVEILPQHGANVAIRAQRRRSCGSGAEGQGDRRLGASLDVADKAALKSFVSDSAKAPSGVNIVIANVSALVVQDSEESCEAASGGRGKPRGVRRQAGFTA